MWDVALQKHSLCEMLSKAKDAITSESGLLRFPVLPDTHKKKGNISWFLHIEFHHFNS